MIIKNGMLALPGEDLFTDADIRIEDGKIVEIAENLSGGIVLNASGLNILPGGIDPHVHFDEPGFTSREDFYHGSMAALSGGITTVIDMPCTSLPPVITERNLINKLSIIEKKSVCDFGLFGGVSGDSFNDDFPQNMEGLKDLVCGYKTYFTSGMDTFKKVNLGEFEVILKKAKELNKIVLLHAEDHEIISKIDQSSGVKPGNTPTDFSNSRPESAEIEAIKNAVEVADSVGAKLHIVHVGTAKAIDLHASNNITFETCPHYLAFGLSDFEKIGSPLKVCPPIKHGRNKKKLWEHIKSGKISIIASDHAPCESKDKNSGSIWEDYSGIPGTSTLLPYMFSHGYLKGLISLSELTDITSLNAAQRYGLSHVKGSISVGKDADLVLIDPKKSFKIKGEEFLSKGKVTPFESTVFKGKICKTILRGEVVFSEEKGVVASKGYGQFLKPK